MTAILSQREALEQEQEKLVTVATTFINQEGRKFPSRPIVVIDSIRSVAQTSAKDPSVEAKSYYLSSLRSGFSSEFLPPQPYQLRTINEQPEELMPDDIAVHTLARSITEQKVGFIQAKPSVKHGKFLTSLINKFPHALPRLQSKFQEPEEDDDEPFWRGVFVVPHQPKVLFSKEIEIKANELSTWKPHVVIDNYRLEDDSE